MMALAFAIALCGVLVFVLSKPVSQQETSNETSTVTGISSTAESEGHPVTLVRTYSLVVKSKRLVDGPHILTAVQGDEIRIKVLSDENEELHIHGYDIKLDLEKNVERDVTLRANLTGRFPFELEKSRQHLGTLEVLPQ
jgi:hypothetical protein